MIKKTSNAFILVIFFLFILLIAKHYFSGENVIFTNKSRTSYSLMASKGIENLPVLKNDTNNIIIYKNDLEKFKKKIKKRFWEKLISNKR